MDIPLACKTTNLWDEVKRLDPRLQGPFLALAWAFYQKWHQVLMVTCCERTEAENEAVSGKPKSGHLDRPCRAIDIRAKVVGDYPGLTPEMVQWIKDFWLEHFCFGPYWSAMDNYPPDRYHVHLQCPRKTV